MPADLARRLGLQEVLDESSEIRQAQQEQWNEPGCIEYERQRALEADAGACRYGATIDTRVPLRARTASFRLTPGAIWSRAFR